jgi:hypothetical protein
MKTPWLALALSLALVGCSKKDDAGSGGTGGGAGGGDRCAAPINKAIDGLVEHRKSVGMPEHLIEVAEKLRTTLLNRCRADNWPQHALDCYAKATDQLSIRDCRKQLPPEMGQKLQAEILQVMGGAAARGGMPPGHGAAPAPEGTSPAPAAPSAPEAAADGANEGANEGGNDGSGAP